MIISKTRFGVFLAAVLLIFPATVTRPSPVRAEDKTSVFGVFSTSGVTPHTPWAKPYVRGTMKVLVIAPSYMQRETVELWQRLDCDVYPLMTFRTDKISTGDLSEQGGGVYGLGLVPGDQAERLAEGTLEQAGDWDVAIVGRYQWDALPSALRLALLLGVRERGAGLVLVEQNLRGEAGKLFPGEEPAGAREYFSNVIPWADLSVGTAVNTNPSDLRLAAYGKGRVAALNYYQQGMGVQPPTRHCLTPGAYRGEPVYRPNSPDYDYFMSLVVRTVLWAGRREASPRFRFFTLPQVTIERARLQTETTLFVPWPTGAPKQHWWLREAAAIRFMVDGGIHPPRMVEWQIRNPWNEVEARGKIEDLDMEAQIGGRIALPVLPGGRHYLETWLKQDGKTADWAIVPFDVEAECRAPVVELDKPGFERGEDVTGRVLLTGELPPNENLKVEIWDNMGRLLAVEPLKGKEAVRRFRCFGLDPITQSYTAKAVVTDDRGVVAEGRIEFLIPKRGNDDYQMHAWYTPTNEPITGYFLDRLRELGVDSIMPCHLWTTPAELLEHSWQCARHNLRIFPYMESICDVSPGVRNEKGEPIMRKDDCILQDREKSCAGLYIRLRERARLYAPFAPQGVMLSEEDGLDFAKNDRCFCPKCRESFRRYLKDAYGTIQALNETWGTAFKDWSECGPITYAQAEKSKQLPRWMDHRMHMMKLWTDYHLAMAQPVAEGDPRIESVFFGDTEEPYYGIDFHRLYGKYGRVFGISDYIPRGRCNAPGYGTYPGHSVTELRLNPWDYLSKGANGVQYWTIADGYSNQGGSELLSPSFETVVDHFDATMESTREIKRGPGRLVIGAVRADDGVRVLDSPASMMVSHFSHTEITWRDSCADLERTLERGGIFYRRMASQQVADGELLFPNVKILILPYSQALSPAEAGKILAFAKAGGTVIADFAPGVMDQHGKRLEISSLKELFPSTKDLTRTALGKGAGIYLGPLLRGRADAQPGPWLGDFLGILKESGVQPRVQIQPVQGPATCEVEPRLFEDGVARYLFLVRGGAGAVSASPWDAGAKKEKGTAEGSEKFILRLPKEAQVYDIREGKYLGGAKEITLDIAAHDVKLLALLPYQTEGMDVSLGTPSGRRIPVKAKLRMAGGKAGRHVFRLTLTGPGGREISCFARNVEAPGGVYETTLPIALNDPPGNYTFAFHDVATGAEGKAEVTVR